MRFVPYPLHKFRLTLWFSYFWLWYLSVLTLYHFLSRDYVCVHLVPLFFFLLKCMQFLKFNSWINLSFIVSPFNERSTYSKDFNCSWSTKPSHSRAALFTFPFIYSKRIYYLVFIIYGGDSICLGEDFHPFTSSFILSTRLLLLHLCIPISSSSLLLYFVSSFTVSVWLFLLHLGLLISSYSFTW